MRPTDEQILTLYASHTAAQCAVILGRPYNTVRVWIQEARTGKRHSRHRSERCTPSRNISAEDIAAIMEMRANRVMWKVIGARFGKHPDTLRFAMRKAESHGMAAFPAVDVAA